MQRINAKPVGISSKSCRCSSTYGRTGSSTIAVVIPLIRMLIKSLEKHHNDVGVRTMKKEMLDAIKRRFHGIKDNKHVAIATLVDPHIKDKFFSGHEQRENVKLMLADELKKIDENRELTQCISLEEPTQDEESPSKRQKIRSIEVVQLYRVINLS